MSKDLEDKLRITYNGRVYTLVVDFQDTKESFEKKLRKACQINYKLAIVGYVNDSKFIGTDRLQNSFIPSGSKTKLLVSAPFSTMGSCKVIHKKIETFVEDTELGENTASYKQSCSLPTNIKFNQGSRIKGNCLKSMMVDYDLFIPKLKASMLDNISEKNYKDFVILLNINTEFSKPTSKLNNEFTLCELQSSGKLRIKMDNQLNRVLKFFDIVDGNELISNQFNSQNNAHINEEKLIITYRWKYIGFIKQESDQYFIDILYNIIKDIDETKLEYKELKCKLTKNIFYKLQEFLNKQWRIKDDSNVTNNDHESNLDDDGNNQISCIEKIFKIDDDNFLQKKFLNFFTHQNVDKIVTKINCTLQTYPYNYSEIITKIKAFIEDKKQPMSEIILLCSSFYSTSNNDFCFMINDCRDINNNHIAQKDFTQFKDIMFFYLKEVLTVNNSRLAHKLPIPGQVKNPDKTSISALTQMDRKNCWLAMLYLVLTTKFSTTDVIQFLKYPSIKIILDLVKHRNIARLCKLAKIQINKIKKSPIKATIDIIKTKNISYLTSFRTISISSRLNNMVMITEEKSLDNTGSNHFTNKVSHFSSENDLSKSKHNEILDNEDENFDKSDHFSKYVNSEVSDFLKIDNNSLNEVKSVDLYRAKLNRKLKINHSQREHFNFTNKRRTHHKNLNYEKIQQIKCDLEDYSISFNTNSSSSFASESNENSDEISEFIELNQQNQYFVDQFYNQMDYLFDYFQETSEEIFIVAANENIQITEESMKNWYKLLESQDPSAAIEKQLVFILDGSVHVERIINQMINQTRNYLHQPINFNQDQIEDRRIENQQHERNVMLHAYIQNSALSYINLNIVDLSNEWKDYILKQLYFQYDIRILGALEIFEIHWDIYEFLENLDLIKNKSFFENNIYCYIGKFEDEKMYEQQKSQIDLIQEYKKYIGKALSDTLTMLVYNGDCEIDQFWHEKQTKSLTDHEFKSKLCKKARDFQQKLTVLKIEKPEIL